VSDLSINPGIEIRDSERELQRFRGRLAILGIFLLSLFGLLLLRFFYLQVIQHGHYSTLAEANRISIQPIAPHRGIIVDRNGVQLAHN
jgi:penicillin-binding protein 2